MTVSKFVSAFSDDIASTAAVPAKKKEQPYIVAKDETTYKLIFLWFAASLFLLW